MTVKGSEMTQLSDIIFKLTVNVYIQCLITKHKKTFMWCLQIKPNFDKHVESLSTFLS